MMGRLLRFELSKYCCNCASGGTLMTESTWNQTALDIVNATRDQYQTSDKLNMRINMHAKYSVNKESFGKMISSYYTIQPGDCILVSNRH